MLKNPKFETLIQLHDLLSFVYLQDSEAAELTLTIKMERMRVAEVIAARDTVVHRLEDAYTSVRQKVAIIDRLERELEDLKRTSTPTTSMSGSGDLKPRSSTPATSVCVSRERPSCTQLPIQATAISSEIQQPVPVEVFVWDGDCKSKSESAHVFTWQAHLVRWSVLTGGEPNL